jgi:hypothetical protein
VGCAAGLYADCQCDGNDYFFLCSQAVTILLTSTKWW